jgi:hypothetical protein
MANKKIWLGMAVLALTFGFVLVGCQNPQQVEGEVSVQYPQVSSPKITEAKTTDGKYLILSWDAVDHASGYNVYANQRNKKTIDGYSIIDTTNRWTYKIDGTEEVNNDTDKWNVKIPLTATTFGAELKDIRIGVQTEAANYGDYDRANSGIAWSAYYKENPHLYTALLGIWKKEGANTSEKQNFEFKVPPSSTSSYPIEFFIRDQTENLRGSGNLTNNAISGSTISNSLTANGDVSNFTIKMDNGKLVVSDISGTYSYLNGTYVK